MTAQGADTTGRERFRRALAGDRVAPPAIGLSFAEPRLLNGDGATLDPAGSLAATCRREHLDFAFVPAHEPWAERAVSLLAGSGVAGAWVVDGVLWPTLGERGPARGLREVAGSANELGPALDRALGRALEEAGRGLDAGAAALVVADDMAGGSGPLVGPAFLSQHVFPRLARVAEAARRAGVPAILHCDGDARLLMEAAAEAGFAAIHGDAGGAGGLEDGFAAARAAGLGFIGGVPTAELSGEAGPLPARWRAGALANDSGLLLADDGGITTADEMAALLAILRASRAGGC
ncbi:MAG TPA: uroporphyrinogen decarboxylase family protein [Coriobacteriia bacterium]